MEKCYTTDEVAKMLKVRRITVERWIRAGMLTAHVFGKKLIRIDHEDFKEFTKVLPKKFEKGLI